MATVAGGILFAQPAAEARENYRLCYYTKDGVSVYFARAAGGTSPKNCSGFYLEVTEGQWQYAAADVPTLNGIDFSICENFTSWEFLEPKGADVCDYIGYEDDYSLDGLATKSGYTLRE